MILILADIRWCPAEIEDDSEEIELLTILQVAKEIAEAIKGYKKAAVKTQTLAEQRRDGAQAQFQQRRKFKKSTPSYGF